MKNEGSNYTRASSSRPSVRHRVKSCCQLLFMIHQEAVEQKGNGAGMIQQANAR